MVLPRICHLCNVTCVLSDLISLSPVRIHVSKHVCLSLTPPGYPLPMHCTCPWGRAFACGSPTDTGGSVYPSIPISPSRSIGLPTTRSPLTTGRGRNRRALASVSALEPDPKPGIRTLPGEPDDIQCILIVRSIC